MGRCPMTDGQSIFKKPLDSSGRYWQKSGGLRKRPIPSSGLGWRDGSVIFMNCAYKL